MMVDIPFVITYAKFGDDRLRGLGVVGVGHISHWLWSSSPLALPCECDFCSL